MICSKLLIKIIDSCRCFVDFLQSERETPERRLSIPPENIGKCLVSDYF